ncbi:MAG TPA: DUF92 domain-containing protein [Gemmatimonadaceae bacterium]|nr:DUF92 domain-containing protein [Gemmatimonadaceae bacterium]
MIARAAAGLALAAAIALAARRARSLSRGGAVAATLLGAVAIAAGWRWGALLLVFFVTSSALSRFGAPRKEARTAGVVAKGGERDAAQVLANGGAFGVAALCSLLWPWTGWAAAGAGALAAAASDTWATEIGTLVGGVPRSLRTGRPAAVGASGAVTAVGTVAAVAGALGLAVAAGALGWPFRAALAALAGGLAGSTADSLIGATLQARRRCEVCGEMTERAIHSCGGTTVPAGGVRWLDNDRVNLASTLVGAAVGAALGA